MDVVTCFRLGRALRYGDADAFFGVYDGLMLAGGNVSQVGRQAEYNSLVLHVYKIYSPVEPL